METLLEDGEHLRREHYSIRRRLTSFRDPLNYLVPITNACLLLTAVIFIMSLGVVFLVVLVAIIIKMNHWYG